LASAGKAAAEANAAGGERGLAAIQRRSCEQGELGPWVIHAAARSTAPHATSWLKSFAAAQHYTAAGRHAAFALALRGEAGRAALGELTHSEDESVREAAEPWLAHPPITLAPFTAWPKLPANCLPKAAR
jgi:hypothetical protein